MKTQKKVAKTAAKKPATKRVYKPRTEAQKQRRREREAAKRAADKKYGTPAKKKEVKDATPTFQRVADQFLKDVARDLFKLFRSLGLAK